MPWDVLVKGLDRYLRIGYVSAVLAGLVIAAEVTILALSGSPGQRREQLADAATSVARWKPNAVLIVLVIAAMLTVAYLVGVTCRSLTFAIFDASANFIRVTRDFVTRWWRGTYRTITTDEGSRPDVPNIRLALDELRQDVRTRWRRGGPSRGERRVPLRYRPWIVVFQVVGRSLMRPLLPPVTRPADLWLQLDYAYGAETVNRMLARHPIKARVATSADVAGWQKFSKGPPLKTMSHEDYRRVTDSEIARVRAEGELQSAVEYCQLWLQRYASEVAIPSRASRVLVLGTAALPAVLLPRTLHEIGADLDVIQSLVGPLRLALLVAAVVLFFGALREAGVYTVATFQRFVVVEMAETTRLAADEPNLDGRSDNDGGDQSRASQ